MSANYHFNWKVHFPQNNIYIMRQHNWAYAAWEIERLKGNLQPNSLLIHVDAHLDDTPDGVFVKGLLEARSIEEFCQTAQGHDYRLGQVCPPDTMQIDNFIWAAVARGTIGETIFVSFQEEEVLSLEEIQQDAIHKRNEYCRAILSKLPEGCAYSHQRFRELDSFLDTFELASYPKSLTKILDLDLDYFIEEDQDQIVHLKPNSYIKESLQKLKNLYDWDVITVALSPEYCGGDEQAGMILEVFAEVFEINFAKAVDW